MPKVRTQADRRKHAMFTDQHRRKWFAVIEKDTMHPCSALTPHGWTEPPGCRVPDQYKALLNESDPFALTIQYDPWVADLEAARDDYDNRCATTAAFMSPDNGGSALFRINADGSRFYAPTLVKYVGPLPAPVELAKAMRAGNKWALGLINPETGKPYPQPAWAERFMPAPDRSRAEEAEQFPDVEDESVEEGEGFEGVGQSPEQFPDEPADRLDGEESDEEEEGDDVFSELSRDSAAVPAAAPTAAPKPPRRGAGTTTKKNKG